MINVRQNDVAEVTKSNYYFSMIAQYHGMSKRSNIGIRRIIKMRIEKIFIANKIPCIFFLKSIIKVYQQTSLVLTMLMMAMHKQMQEYLILYFAVAICCIYCTFAFGFGSSLWMLSISLSTSSDNVTVAALQSSITCSTLVVPIMTDPM